MASVPADPPAGKPRVRRSRRNARDGKPPAFQFYAADWLADAYVQRMSAAEEGTYCRLLCYAFREHGLPVDPEEVRKLTKLPSGAVWRRAWSAISMHFLEGYGCGCGEDHGPRLRNPRQERDREHACEVSIKRSVSGSAGADARWHGKPIANGMATDSSASASASAIPELVLPLCLSTRSPDAKSGAGVKRKESRARSQPEEAEGFAEFYSAYPRKVDRKEAVREWNALGPPGPELRAEIMAGLERWRHSREWQDGKIVYPQRFLKRERWKAQVEAESQDWKSGFLNSKGNDEGNDDDKLRGIAATPEVAAKEAEDP